MDPKSFLHPGLDVRDHFAITAAPIIRQPGKDRLRPHPHLPEGVRCEAVIVLASMVLEPRIDSIEQRPCAFGRKGHFFYESTPIRLSRGVLQFLFPRRVHHHILKIPKHARSGIGASRIRTSLRAGRMSRRAISPRLAMRRELIMRNVVPKDFSLEGRNEDGSAASSVAKWTGCHEGF